jgi:hypothetical protein
MLLDKLIPTHNSLREPLKVTNIMEAIKNGSFENKEPCVIFKVGQANYIWNGHHRLVAASLLDYLDTDQLPFPIEVKEWKYEELVSINFAVGYVTPFDPAHYCRTPNFFTFKKRIMNVFREWSFQDALYFISERFSDYAEPRRIYSLKELS